MRHNQPFDILLGSCKIQVKSCKPVPAKDGGRVRLPWTYLPHQIKNADVWVLVAQIPVQKAFIVPSALIPKGGLGIGFMWPPTHSVLDLKRPDYAAYLERWDIIESWT